MKYSLLIFLLGLLLAADVAAQTPKQPPVKILDDELRILTWNIQMLPRLIARTRRGPMKRARLIPEKLINDSLHIIVFEECFDARARRILKRRLRDKFPYYVGPANKKTFRLKTNSGVMIFSKLPLTELGEIEFTDCNVSDCYAFKGALMVEATFKGVTFQVLGTHLQAWHEYDTTRAKQLVQIKQELIDPNTKPGIPQFISGDLNTRHSGDNYEPMLKILDAEDGPIYGEFKHSYSDQQNDLADPGDPELIDYILYKGNGKPYYYMFRSITQYQHRWSERHKDLSDHNGLLMRVVFTRVSDGEPKE